MSQNVVTSDPGLLRSFRVRQRGLLHNTYVSRWFEHFVSRESSSTTQKQHNASVL